MHHRGRYQELTSPLDIHMTCSDWARAAHVLAQSNHINSASNVVRLVPRLKASNPSNYNLHAPHHFNVRHLYQHPLAKPSIQGTHDYLIYSISSSLPTMKASLGCLLYLGLLLSLLVRGTVSNKPHGFGSLPNSGLSDGVQDNETINEESLRALSEAQNASISARWYSVDTIANLEADGNMQATAHGPWPVVCGQQYVRYCFKDEQSAQDLTSIVAHAIVMWFPAGFYSGMVIQPDPACGKPGEYNDYSCVCGEQEEGGRTSDDALVIDNGADGSDNPPLVIASTIGYNRASDEPGRHSLTFSLLRQPDGASSHLFRGYQISHMTHELGEFYRCVSFGPSLISSRACDWTRARTSTT